LQTAKRMQNEPVKAICGIFMVEGYQIKVFESVVAN